MVYEVGADDFIATSMTESIVKTRVKPSHKIPKQGLTKRIPFY